MQHWIGVVSAEHVARGVAGGFMQVCHGRAGPLARISPGDGFAYYSPTTSFGGKDALRCFTGIGRVAGGQPYAFDMGNGFVPHRRDIDWWPARDAPIAPLLPLLSFSQGGQNWGYRLRFGLFTITEDDFTLIATAMRAKEPVRSAALSAGRVAARV